MDELPKSPLRKLSIVSALGGKIKYFRINSQSIKQKRNSKTDRIANKQSLCKRLLEFNQ
jgi:hypothetical protein